MNSLLAALLKWRFFVMSIGLSGVVHLALIGGWWMSWHAANIGGADVLAINLTVSASTVGEASAVVADEKSADARNKPLRDSDERLKTTSEHQVTPSTSKAILDKPADHSTSAAKPINQPISQPITASKPLNHTATAATEAAIEAPEIVAAPLPTRYNTINTAALQASSASAASTAVLDTLKPTSTASGSLVSSAPSSTASVAQGAPIYHAQPSFMTPPSPPQYPRLARKRGIEGRVMLQVTINRHGAVEALQVAQSSGSELLDRAAQKAVQDWQFVPARQNGIAVASYVRVPIDFVLEKH
ncbi:energy transducer TonB [Amphritea sp. 1_MG-2023]|uniref:energy transducer TonB n=1 Tax=Amphritea sp. 1_MG-2023 TaxID=3062670 RepID=UPI0026E43A50|nr:energy transducer TonB [Amphritea sp. 1_MG-2023]MDO6563903.1 energy transducer TonB [Amphritea sp. 1_MG-2023]